MRRENQVGLLLTMALLFWCSEAQNCSSFCAVKCDNSGCSCPADYCQQLCECTSGGYAKCVCEYNCPLPTSATSSSTAVCFPPSSLVELRSGAKKRVENLVRGDEILSIDDDGNPTYTEFRLFAKVDRDVSAIYLKLHTNSTAITLSATHLLYVSEDGNPANKRLIIAIDVREGDLLLVWDGKRFVTQPVIVVEAHLEDGAYLPFTVNGDLVVDGVAASNAANTRPEWAGVRHALFKPVILWPDLLTFLPRINAFHPYVYLHNQMLALLTTIMGIDFRGPPERYLYEGPSSEFTARLPELRTTQ